MGLPDLDSAGLAEVVLCICVASHILLIRPWHARAMLVLTARLIGEDIRDDVVRGFLPPAHPGVEEFRRRLATLQQVPAIALQRSFEPELDDMLQIERERSLEHLARLEAARMSYGRATFPLGELMVRHQARATRSVPRLVVESVGEESRDVEYPAALLDFFAPRPYAMTSDGNDFDDDDADDRFRAGFSDVVRADSDVVRADSDVVKAHFGVFATDSGDAYRADSAVVSTNSIDVSAAEPEHEFEPVPVMVARPSGPGLERQTGSDQRTVPEQRTPGDDDRADHRTARTWVAGEDKDDSAEAKPAGDGAKVGGRSEFWSESGLSESSLSGPGSSESGSSEPGLSEPGLSEPGLSEPGLSEPGSSESGLSEHGLSEPSLSEPSPSIEAVTASERREEDSGSQDHPDRPDSTVAQPSDGDRGVEKDDEPQPQGVSEPAVPAPVSPALVSPALVSAALVVAASVDTGVAGASPAAPTLAVPGSNTQESAVPDYGVPEYPASAADTESTSVADLDAVARIDQGRDVVDLNESDRPDPMLRPRRRHMRVT